jgi:hypothetical protein
MEMHKEHVMTSPKSDEGRQKPSRESALENRYGTIGISAVAAALRYQSDSKNPAYAPVREDLNTEDMDAAA